MELIEQIVKQILFEFAFWGTIASISLVFYKIYKESSRKELLAILAIFSLGLILRLKYGFFAPVHEKIQYVEILNNYYYNYLNHSFFIVVNHYHSTFGFIDFFY